VAPLVLELTGKRTPRVGLEGKFSVYHSAAVAILDGAAGERQYSDSTVRNPKVIALRDRVSAEADASIRDDEAYVKIRLKTATSLKSTSSTRSEASTGRYGQGSEALTD
jgi:2-methylcitrate dehydratase PrpD